MAGGSRPSARHAGTEDLDEVLRLAGIMYSSMGQDPGSPGWRESARALLAPRLGRDATVVVVDHPSTEGLLIASAAGTVSQRLPGPDSRSALVGYVQWVATDPAHRRAGHARTVMEALLDWFREEECEGVELHATADAEHLYRSLGFEEGPNTALRIRRLR